MAVNMKRNRQEKIIELIEENEIETQEELAEYLKAEGYQVTQATISRDIRELKLSKIASADGRQKYVVYENTDAHLGDKYIRVLKDGYVSMNMAQSLLVVKTVAGMAMAVAAAVDAMRLPQIVGCIAGDDTIMVALRETEDARGVMEQIHKIIG